MKSDHNRNVNNSREGVRILPTAEIAADPSIWYASQVRGRAEIGKNCNLGRGLYVDFDVRIGDNCIIQNSSSICHGTTLADGVIVGTQVIFTNDKLPRAINPDGSPKSNGDMEIGPIDVDSGASLEAGVNLDWENPESIANGVSTRVDDEETRARMMRSGFSCILSNHSREETAETLASLLDGLVEVKQ